MVVHTVLLALPKLIGARTSFLGAMHILMRAAPMLLRAMRTPMRSRVNVEKLKNIQKQG